MKQGLVLLFWLCLVCSVDKSSATTCLWYNGTCVEECPEGLVVVWSNCSKSYWPALRTCDNPEVTNVGSVCGFARCDCPNDLVLDTDTGICYDFDDCPPKHHNSQPGKSEER